MAQEFFKDLEQRKINISQTQKGFQIQQTERNKLKAEMEDVVMDILAKAIPDTVSIDKTKDGIVLGIFNEVTSETIPVVIDLTIKSLDYDIESAVEDYEISMRDKAIKAEKAAAAKAKKIESDKALRERMAAKAKEKENV